jgi:hypothetical protein
MGLNGGRPVAADYAILAVFGVFGLLNLIEYRRID